MNEVGFSDEYKALKLRYAALRERVANQIEMFTHLVEVVGPNMKAQYMMLVGQYEIHAMRLEIEVKRWKRRITLRQQYVNRGEKPDMVAIEALLDEEFAEWRKKLEGAVEKIKDSKLLWDMEKLSDEDTSAIRCDYLKAVKKLHPDLNPDLSEAAVSLWNKVQDAYAKKDWRRLKFLVSLVDEVVAGQDTFDETPEGLEKLRAACARLEEKEHEVSRQIAELKAHEPFTYLVLLEDKELLKQKQDELKTKIADMAM